VRITREDLAVSLALVALGIADDEEAALVEDVCGRSPTAARLRSELTDVAASLPLALPRARPPPYDGA
jgi:hypothetical protein